MPFSHSWKWLAPRLTSRKTQDSQPAATPSRPPLASIEPLDDRIMLSAAVTTGGSGDTAILANLLKGGSNLSASEFAFLKLYQAADGKHVNKLQTLNIAANFHKIDTLLFNWGEDLIKLRTTTTDHKMQPQVDAIFDKIGPLFPRTSRATQAQLTASLQQTHKLANEFIESLSELNGDKASIKLKSEYLDLSDQFLKIDLSLLAYGAAQSDPAQNKYFAAALGSLFHKGEQQIKAIGGNDTQTLLPMLKIAQSKMNSTLTGPASHPVLGTHPISGNLPITHLPPLLGDTITG